MSSAEETLSILKDIEGKSNMWLATTKYYFEYFSVYALLMKIGIKSEIHDCTLAVCKILEDEKILPEGTYEMLEQDKQLRIDNQYYLKNKEEVLFFWKIIPYFYKQGHLFKSVFLNFYFFHFL